MKSIELIYQNNDLLNLITRAVDNERNYVANTEMLEDRIYKRLSRYIKGDEERAKHFVTIKRMVYETISEFKETYRKEFYEHFSEFDTVNTSDGSTTEFEPIDVLADVEGEVITKEMTALLAQDDQRKLVILGSWKVGNDNNTEISRLLAQSVGGKIESHRKFIQRFRNECREKLATAI